jgi:hypothetical protein
MHSSLISSKRFHLVFFCSRHYRLYPRYVVTTIKFIQIYNFLYFPYMEKNTVYFLNHRLGPLKGFS